MCGTQPALMYTCLNLLPVSKRELAALPDALMIVSALDDKGSPGREKQPKGFRRKGLPVLKAAEGWRRPLPPACF